MSDFKDELISKAVGRLSEPVDVMRAIRSAGYKAIGHAILLFAALETDNGWLLLLLGLWMAYRAFVSVVMAWVGPEVHKERERRLSALPSGWRNFLITAERPREYTTYPGGESA